MRHAIVNDQTKEVVNVIMWDGSPWNPPKEHTVIPTYEACIGDIWNENKKEFMRPMSRQKPPENQDHIDSRIKEFNESKEKLQSSILFENPISKQLIN